MCPPLNQSWETGRRKWWSGSCHHLWAESQRKWLSKGKSGWFYCRRGHGCGWAVAIEIHWKQSKPQRFTRACACMYTHMHTHTLMSYKDQKIRPILDPKRWGKNDNQVLVYRTHSQKPLSWPFLNREKYPTGRSINLLNTLLTFWQSRHPRKESIRTTVAVPNSRAIRLVLWAYSKVW